MSSRLAMIIFFLMMFGGQVATPQEKPTEKPTAHAGSDDVTLGVGYDLVGDRAQQHCVANNKTQTVAGQIESNFLGTVVTSKEELLQLLDASVSGSASFVGGGGSAKAAFASRFRLSKTSIYAVVRLSLSAQPVVLAGERLTDEAKAVLSTRGPAKFREACGDVYIFGYTPRADFYAVLDFSVSDESQQKSLLATASANGLVWSGEASVKRQVKHLATRSKVSMNIFQEGASVPVPESEPDNLIELANRFAQNFYSQPKNRGAGSYTYKDYNGLIVLAGLSQTPIDVSAALDTLAKLSQFDINRAKNLDVIDDILKRSTEYASGDIQALHTAKSALARMEALIDDNIKRCRTDYSKCLLNPEIKPISIKIPAPVNKRCPIFPTGTDAKICGTKEVQQCEEICPSMEADLPSKGRCRKACMIRKVPLSCSSPRFGKPKERRLCS